MKSPDPQTQSFADPEPAALVAFGDFVADHRWLATLASQFPQMWIPPQPDCSAHASLAEYASQWIEQGLQRELLPRTENRPWIACGIGWGSPLAIEVAIAMKKGGLPPTAILLVGGCRSAEAIKRSLVFSVPLATRLPAPFFRQWVANQWLGIGTEAGQLKPELNEIVKNFLRSLDLVRLRSTIRSIAAWRRTRSELDELTIPIHQIHGRADRVVARPSLDDATILLHGGHLIHLGAADEVNRWIAAIIRDEQLRRKFAMSKQTKPSSSK